ncbi:Calcium-dependent protein kinase 19 [Heracleum sosnowskyi]|uniref:Calcium-dependent protein kinase 19 n=1 Tax=Heracleum sosnowskyi TaxID=360622 RepID=A0AAD8JGM6_9APIA|nr:Calcium-dependent protein kinase 19 [Heracleum sosnowskyi]
MHSISCPHHLYLHTATTNRVHGSKINNKPGFKNNKYEVVARSGRDSEFEIDQDKAREALKKLDQQLQSISDKPTQPPKLRAADVKYTREQAEIDRSTGQSSPGLADGSFQASLVFVLLIFTIFYNVIFITVIKPSIDGPDSPPTTLSTTKEPSKAAILQRLLLGP